MSSTPELSSSAMDREAAAGASVREQLAARMVHTLPSFGIWATAIRDFETPYGKLGLRQAEVLYALRYGLVSTGPVSPSMLSEHFHVQPSAITRVLNRLEASDYVERRVDPKDGRAQTIHVTERGEAISVAIERVFIGQMNDAIACVPDDDLEGLSAHVDLLGRVAQSLLLAQQRLGGTVHGFRSDDTDEE
jgi:DNA-binding MarR family transcriptional regulator